MAARGAEVRVYGIRHHGPGSARSVLRALESFRPEAVLIEGPPDADALLPLAAAAGMEPPVALLVHAEADPAGACFWPFATFSPEWVALRWALAAGVEVRFMDLPFAHREAVARRSSGADPLGLLARAAGFSDGERWWDAVVERSGGDEGAFAAIAEAMRTLREMEREPVEPDAEEDEDEKAGRRHEARREAWMRKTLHAACRSRGRVAVICGAWHVPALEEGKPRPEDKALLADLPKEKVLVAWVPWTHGHLAQSSGYGAGVVSPGWYAHLWASAERGEDRTRCLTSWIAGAARLMRDERLDAPTASVVEAVRLAETLAALRGVPIPGLEETEEAMRAVLTHGQDAPLAVVRRKLIIGERLGGVPEEAPRTPLQRDIEAEGKRLRLKRSPEAETLHLDLRTPNGLARSVLMHRLTLLGVPWGTLDAAVKGLGTFKEGWVLAWRPEFEVEIVVASSWGNTLRDAATTRAAQRAEAESAVAELAGLLNAVILADLPEAASALMARLERAAAAGGDVTDLMAALPAAAAALRYGSVRRFDAALLARVVEGMAARAAAGLGAACRGIDDSEADRLARLIMEVTDTLVMLDHADLMGLWLTALKDPAEAEQAHGLLSGLACRLLLDRAARDMATTSAAMSRALSPAAEACHAGAWAVGFLRPGAAALIHGDALWAVLDGWVRRLDEEAFLALLPLLRRAFAPLQPAERRQLGQKAQGSSGSRRVQEVAHDPVPAIVPAGVLRAARFLGLPKGGRQ